MAESNEQNTGNWTPSDKSNWIRGARQRTTQHRFGQKLAVPSSEGWVKSTKPSQKNSNQENIEKQPPPVTFSRSAARQKEFMEHMSTAMPEIHRAKQFALTVDGQRRSAVKENAESKLAVALVVLSDDLNEMVTKIDGQSKLVRQHAEKKDFDAAQEEFDKGFTLAKDILGKEDEFQKLLKEADQEVPPLAGTPTETTSREQRDFDREFKRCDELLQQALSIKSEAKSVTEPQTLVGRLRKDCLAYADEKNIYKAGELLGYAVQHARVTLSCQQRLQQFESELSSYGRLFGQLEKLTPEPNSEQAGFKQQALDSRDAATAAARDTAEFDVAQQKLKEAIEAANKALLDGGRLAQSFDSEWRKISAVVEQALNIKSDNAFVQDLQKGLDEYKKNIEKAALDHDYATADDEMGLAHSRARWVLDAEQQWQEFRQELLGSQQQLDAAAKLPTSEQIKAQQEQLAIAREELDRHAQQGNYGEARKALNTALSLAVELLTTGGSKQMAGYFAGLDDNRALFQQADEVVPVYQCVKDAQKSYGSEKQVMVTCESQSEWESAEMSQSIVFTRATILVQLGQQQREFEIRRQALREVFEAAQKADSDIPGVGKLQQQLNNQLQQAETTAATDLVKAKQQLTPAFKTANEILGLSQTKDRQQGVFEMLQGPLDDVKRTYLPTGTADGYGSENINDNGGRFDMFLGAMRKLETDRAALENEQKQQVLNPGEIQRLLKEVQTDVERLRANATAFLKDLAKLSESQRNSKENQRRKQICETALQQAAHLKLAYALESIGPPPWDKDQEGRVGQLRSEVAFEDGYLKAEKLQGGGVNASYWINNVLWGDTPGSEKKQKQLLFKPSESEEPIMGFPEGSLACREVMGKATNDTLQAMTGLDFGIPETYVISVPISRIDGQIGEGMFTGSAQAFAPSQGGYNEMLHRDPSFPEKIPKTETQKMAILDIVMVQTDRNPGNFMVGMPDQNGNPTLVPIDHGLVLPNREGLVRRTGRGIINGNVLLNLPGADEKFDEEMQSRIELIDPDQIATALQQQRDVLKSQHGTMDVDSMINDEAILMAKRSAQFLKYAAKELTIQEIFNVIAVDNVDLLLCDDNDREQVFADAVARAKDRSKAKQSWKALSENERNEMREVLVNLGWECPFNGFMSGKNFDLWLEHYGPQALKWYKSRIENPAVRKEINDGLKTLGDPQELKQEIVKLPLPKQLEKVREAVSKIDPLMEREEELAELARKLGFKARQFSVATKQLLADIADRFGEKAHKQFNLERKLKDAEREKELYKLMIVGSFSSGEEADKSLKEMEKEHPRFATRDFAKAYENVKYFSELKDLEKEVGIDLETLVGRCVIIDPDSNNTMYSLMGKLEEGILTKEQYDKEVKELRTQEELKYVTSVREGIELLKKYKAYQQMGGDNALAKTGDDISEVRRFKDKYDRLLTLQRQRQGEQEVNEVLEKSLYEDKHEGKMSTEAQEHSRNRIVDYLTKPDPLRDDGITEQMYKDLSRATYVLNGKTISSSGKNAKPENAIENLKKVLTPEMLAAISQFAHQGMQLAMQEVIQLGKGPIAQMPVPVQGTEEKSYEINSNPNGDVTVHATYSVKVGHLMNPQTSEMQELNPISNFQYAFTVSLNAYDVRVGKVNPQLGPIDYHFDLVPA